MSVHACPLLLYNHFAIFTKSNHAFYTIKIIEIQFPDLNKGLWYFMMCASHENCRFQFEGFNRKTKTKRKTKTPGILNRNQDLK